MNFRLFVFNIFFIAELFSHAKVCSAVAGVFSGSTSCEVKVERAGCFKDKSRPLDKLIVYRRSTLDQEPQQTALPRLLCDCATKARSQGYSYIGLQFYAECWTSSETGPDYSRDGPSTDQCFTADYQICSPHDKVCVGGANTNFVYKIVNWDEAVTEMPTQASSTDQEILPSTAPTSDTAEASKQPSKHALIPSTAQSPPSQMSTEKQSEQPSPTSPTAQHSEISKPTSAQSELTSQITEKPLLNNKIPSPDVVLTANNKPCEDNLPDCAHYQSYCSSKYPYTLQQCPKTCQLCA